MEQTGGIPRLLFTWIPSIHLFCGIPREKQAQDTTEYSIGRFLVVQYREDSPWISNYDDKSSTDWITIFWDEDILQLLHMKPGIQPAFQELIKKLVCMRVETNGITSTHPHLLEGIWLVIISVTAINSLLALVLFLEFPVSIIIVLS